MNLVWNSTLDGSSKRFVLLALADRASDQGECSALGVPTLCRKTGISRSTMFRLLQELELDDQLIQREEQLRTNGSRKASRFWINLGLLTAMQRSGDDDRDTEEPTNPFNVSAAQTPVPIWDGPRPESGLPPVLDQDPLPVPESDGARPDLGPLDPFSSSETDKDPETRTDGSASPASTDQRRLHADQAACIVSALDLRQCGPSPKQVSQITNAVAAALTRGIPLVAVSDHAHRKVGEAKTVKYLLAAFSADHLPTATAAVRSDDAGLPPVCGQCDARPGDPVSGRVVWLDTRPPESRPCPQCHPRAIKSTGGVR